MYLNSESLQMRLIIFKLILLGLGIVIFIRLIHFITFFYEFRTIEVAI
ncbi:hypothetical protein J2749_001199 [Methanobacterium oryzae]